MICALNGQKLLSDSQLFSPTQYTTTHTNYGYERVEIESMTGTFNLELANNLWSTNAFYLPFNVDARGSNFNDLFDAENTFYK